MSNDGEFKSNWKPVRTARKKAERKKRLGRRTTEDQEKAKVRKRDKWCRFPLCGCQKLGLRREVSHDQHKGMGGNPEGDRSVDEWMVYLCVHRHQDGPVSRHKGTLRSLYLTDKGYNGPVAWHVDASIVRVLAMNQAAGIVRRQLEAVQGDWYEVARESAVQQLEPLQDTQRFVLEQLAEMDL